MKVGHLYWVLGGVETENSNPVDSFPKQRKTSLFSLKKESWIQGIVRFHGVKSVLQFTLIGHLIIKNTSLPESELLAVHCGALLLPAVKLAW